MKKILLILAVVFLMSGAAAFGAVEHTFHGQFRINGYSLSNSSDGPGLEHVAAQRLRWRPTWDAKLNDDVSVHTQFNIGHIESNTSNARYNQSGETLSTAPTSTNPDPAFGLRHAVLDFKFLGGRVNAGIVPISDKFGDTLFSGDWDFNPVAYVWLGKLNTVDVRVGTGKLQEKEATKRDDMDIYVLDADAAAGAKGNIGGSFYRFTHRDFDANSATSGPVLTQNYVGVRFSQDMGVKLNVFALYNRGELKDETGAAPTEKNKGYAIKVEGLLSSGKANFGVMALMASGDKDAGTAGKTSFDSFITPMTVIGHTGYWGYTGKLNIQGPTDTGIDNPLNIDGAAYGTGNGAGLGIMTLQVKADFPIVKKLSGYVAAGYYSHAEAPAGFKKAIGTDVYVEAKYNLAENLNWQLGVDYAMLNKNNAAYDYAKDNNITLFFSRLQLEY